MDEGCHLSWRVAGSNDIPRVKLILHYITHTESSRKRLISSESAANTCETARSRLDAGRSA